MAAHEYQLPWELIEEILSRVSPKSLVRFRVVRKRWKVIVDDETFIYNHKETFQFILATKSKIYSVSMDPKMKVRELSLDIPGLEAQKPKKLVSCDEFLICSMDKGAAVCNPWLKQTTWISEPSLHFYGIGHPDSNNRSKESVYKTIWGSTTGWKIHDLASGTWIDMGSKSSDSNQGEKRHTMHSTSGVFLNGKLFWIITSADNAFVCCLNTDISKEGFYRYCDLPFGINHPLDALVLRIFKGDCFSVLKQCYVTKKTEVWVTKNKVSVEDGRDVVWMNFMTFSIPNFPGLVPFAYPQQPSYFINKNERLVVCFCDESGKAWIYVMAENKLISKVKIESVVDPWPLHCTYFPNLVSVPRGLIDEAESKG